MTKFTHFMNGVNRNEYFDVVVHGFFDRHHSNPKVFARCHFILDRTAFAYIT